MKKKIGLTLITFAVIAVILWHSDSFSLNQTLTHLKAISPHTLALVLLFISLQFISQSLRLLVLIPNSSFKNIFRLIRIFCYGQVMNHWLPARAGDIYKLTQISKLELSEKITKTRTLFVLAADRFAHIAALIVLMLITNIKKIVDLLTTTDQKTAFFLIGGIVLIAMLVLFRKKLRLEKILLDLKKITFSKRFFYALIISLSSWFFESNALMSLCHSIGIEISFNQTVLVLFSLSIGISVPISVANIGPYEAAITFALTQIGVAANSAISAALFHHVTQTVTIVSMSIIIFIITNLIFLFCRSNKVGSACREDHCH